MLIINGWLSDADTIISPHFNQRPCEEIRLLVIHNISLPPNQFNADSQTDYISDLFVGKLDCSHDPYFKGLVGLEVSAHCLITRSGRVKQYVSFLDRAWHAGRSSYQGITNCNDYSIGIELEGSDRIPYTDAQYDALIRLTKTLMVEYPKISIPSIVGHSDIAPNRKSDPGVAFDWIRFRKSL